MKEIKYALFLHSLMDRNKAEKKKLMINIILVHKCHLQTLLFLAWHSVECTNRNSSDSLEVDSILKNLIMSMEFCCEPQV